MAPNTRTDLVRFTSVNEIRCRAWCTNIFASARPPMKPAIHPHSMRYSAHMESGRTVASSVWRGVLYALRGKHRDCVEQRTCCTSVLPLLTGIDEWGSVLIVEGRENHLRPALHVQFVED